MPKTSGVYIRVDPEIKKQAESVLGVLGIQLSNAFNLFLNQIILQNGLPFDVKIPEDKKPMVLRKMTEEETKEAIAGGLEDVENGKTRDAKEVLDGLKKEYHL